MWAQSGINYCGKMLADDEGGKLYPSSYMLWPS